MVWIKTLSQVEGVQKKIIKVYINSRTAKLSVLQRQKKHSQYTLEVGNITKSYS